MNCAYDNNIIKKNNLKNLKRLHKQRLLEYNHAIEAQTNKSKEFDDDINKLHNEKYDLETKIEEILEEHYWLKY